MEQNSVRKAGKFVHKLRFILPILLLHCLQDLVLEYLIGSIFVFLTFVKWKIKRLTAFLLLMPN